MQIHGIYCYKPIIIYTFDICRPKKKPDEVNHRA